MRPVDQPLLHILQHLLHHCVKGPQLSSCTEMYREVPLESNYQKLKTDFQHNQNLNLLALNQRRRFSSANFQAHMQRK